MRNPCQLLPHLCQLGGPRGAVDRPSAFAILTARAIEASKKAHPTGIITGEIYQIILTYVWSYNRMESFDACRPCLRGIDEHAARGVVEGKAQDKITKGVSGFKLKALLPFFTIKL